MIRFITKTFDQLSNYELYRLLQLRSEVFVVEQNCPYLDGDDKDQQCLHVLGYHNEELAAYARLVPQGISYDEASIGRVVTSPEHRKQGYGRQLMIYCISGTQHHFKTKNIVISAQQYLEQFYTELGFKTQSEVYLEDNIPHIKMKYLAA